MNALLTNTALPRPEGLDRGRSYAQLLERLNEMSVQKCHDPYRDIDWDAPDNRIAAADPRMCLPDDHPLAASAWYRELPAEQRARFAIEWTAQLAKYAIGFEAVLSRGLLQFTQQVPNGSPEYRYAMHEVVEEGRHSMMFQELINRSGCDPHPVTGFDRFMDDRVAPLGRTFPTLFFFAVLSGEIFIDQQNRELLRRPRHTVHPLVRRVMQIHVTEEARHVCFAESYLRAHLPACSRTQRAVMAWAVPVILSEGKRVMLVPDRRLQRKYGIRKQDMRAAFGPGTEHRKVVAATVEPVRQLCEEHGLYRPRHARLWRAFGLVE